MRVLGIGFIISLVLFSACRPTPPFDVQFSNESSYIIRVYDVVDGTPPEFELQPGEDLDVVVDSENISFGNTPALPFVLTQIGGRSDGRNYVTFQDGD